MSSFGNNLNCQNINLSTINGNPYSTGTNQNLQQVCDQGNSTTTSITCNQLEVTNGFIVYQNPSSLTTKGSVFLTTDTTTNEVVLQEVDIPTSNTPTLSEVLQAGSIGSNMSLTATLNAFSIFVSNSLNYVFNINGSLITSELPLINLTSAYKDIAPAASIRFTGALEGYVASEPIVAGNVVQLNSAVGANMNEVRNYNNSTTGSAGNIMVLGVCIQTASQAGNTCQVLTNGITSVKTIGNNTWVKGQIVTVDNSGVTSAAVTSDTPVLGYCLENITTTNGQSILVKVRQGMYEFF